MSMEWMTGAGLHAWGPPPPPPPPPPSRPKLCLLSTPGASQSMAARFRSQCHWPMALVLAVGWPENRWPNCGRWRTVDLRLCRNTPKEVRSACCACHACQYNALLFSIFFRLLMNLSLLSLSFSLSLSLSLSLYLSIYLPLFLFYLPLFLSLNSHVVAIPPSPVKPLPITRSIIDLLCFQVSQV